MVRLACGRMIRLPMSLFAEEVSCPGPPTQERGGQEEEEKEEEEEEVGTAASPQAADPDTDSIWHVRPDPVDSTRRLRCRW